MTIDQFISRWETKLNNSADKNGDVKLKKSQVIQFQIDLYSLRQNDSSYIHKIEYYSVYDAAKEWYDKKGTVTVNEMAEKYGVNAEGLQIYIQTALSLKDMFPPFEKNMSIWDLFYYTQHKQQPTTHYF